MNVNKVLKTGVHQYLTLFTITVSVYKYKIARDIWGSCDSNFFIYYNNKRV